MKYAIVDYRISEEEITTLKKLKIVPLLCPKDSNLYNAINGHPDIQINVLTHKEILLSKNIEKNFSKKLTDLGFSIYFSNSFLEKNYPYNIGLNAVNLDAYFLHFLKYSDKKLLELVSGKTLINTKQGYSKCSTAVISNNAIITSDASIINSVKGTSIDSLYIESGHIDLPGLNYGFIGGTCGLIDNNKLAFFGELSHHPDYKIILEFLTKHNVEPIYLKKGPLIDRGSLFLLEV